MCREDGYGEEEECSEGKEKRGGLNVESSGVERKCVVIRSEYCG